MSIEESKLRVWVSFSAPVLLVFVAVAMILGEGPVWLTVVSAVAALLLGWFVLYDFALSVELDDRGISRRCVVRLEEIQWRSIEKLIHPGKKGLVAVTEDGKHHILIDRKLDSSELDLLRAQARLHQVQFET